jgi:hypothetical protein
MSTLTVQTGDLDSPEKEGQLIYEKTGEGRRKWSSAVMGGVHRLSSPLVSATDFDLSYEIEKNINMQVRHQFEDTRLTLIIKQYVL